MKLWKQRLRYPKLIEKWEDLSTRDDWGNLDRLDRIEFYPDDRGRLSRPGRFAIVWVAFPYDRPRSFKHFFETTGTIRTIIWKPGLRKPFARSGGGWEFFFSLGEETISCLRKYIKEISLSIWASHHNKSSPAIVHVNLHIDGRQYSSFLR